MKTCDECGKETEELFEVEHSDGQGTEYYCEECYNEWYGINNEN